MTNAGEIGSIASAAFSRDLRYWAAGVCRAASAAGVCLSGRVSLWNTDPRRRRVFGDKGSQSSVTAAIAYSPDGERLAYGRDDYSGDSHDLAVHVLTTADPGAREIAAFPSRYGVQSLAFSADRRLLVAGTCVKLRSNVECARGGIEIWDLASHRRRLVKVDRPSAVDWVAVTPGKTVVASAGRAVLLWEPASKRLRKVIELSDAHVALALSPDGTTLAAGGCGKAGSQSAGNIVETYYTSSGCAQGRIDFWNLKDGKPIGPPVRAHTDVISALAFAPDGKTVYSGSGEFDGTIRAWDAHSHRELGRPLAASPGGIDNLAVSPDGKLLASSYKEGVGIWDLASGERLTEALPYSVVYSGNLAFDPRESTLAAASRGVVRWRLSLSALSSEACAIANRNLSRAEWRSYVPSRPYARTCPALPDGA